MKAYWLLALLPDCIVVGPNCLPCYWYYNAISARLQYKKNIVFSNQFSLDQKQ